jgi:hypothetical protein
MAHERNRKAVDGDLARPYPIDLGEACACFRPIGMASGSFPACGVIVAANLATLLEEELWK